MSILGLPSLARMLLGAGTIFGFAFLAAQEPAQENPPVTIREEISLVTLTATVLDREGRLVQGLGAQDFQVYEDGVPQEIAFFEPEELPVSIGVVFDTSGSMFNKIEDVKDGVKHFVDTVNPRDDIFLVRFASYVDLVVDSTDDRKRLHRAVERLRPHGTTRLFEALAEALVTIGQSRHKKKAILLVTDGRDTASDITLEEMLAMVRSSEVLVYALGIGHEGSESYQSLAGLFEKFGHAPPGDLRKGEVDMSVLDSLAEVSGGRSYFIEEAHSTGIDRLDIACQEVSAELRRQYTLGYYASNTERDGRYRTLSVETRNRKYIVRARKGYFAPAADSVEASAADGGLGSALR